MNRQPSPGRPNAVYPRVKVWWNGKFWAVVALKNPIHMAGQPVELSDHGRALDHAIGQAERLTAIRKAGIGRRSMFSEW